MTVEGKMLSVLAGYGAQPRLAPTPQTQGLVAGVIRSVTTEHATFTIPSYDGGRSYFKAKWNKAGLPPSVGADCLVSFTGVGLDDAWIVSWYTPEGAGVVPGVTSVSANGGVASSGGTTPNVSLAQIPAWAPITNYAAGQLVRSPLGAYTAGVVSLIQAVSTFTSGSAFSATNWTHLADIGSSSASGVQLIQRIVLSAAAASVTFSSIPQTYENLCLTIVERCSDASFGTNIGLRFNGDTGANYDFAQVYGGANSTGDGTTLASTYIKIAEGPAANAAANWAASVMVKLPGYARTVFYKGAISYLWAPENVSASGLYAEVCGGHWHSIAAISSLTLFDQAGGNFISGSVFSLYGEP